MFGKLAMSTNLSLEKLTYMIRSLFKRYFYNFKVNSFLGLWPYVKPHGGIYVLEDILFTYVKGFNNSNESAIDMIHKLIMLFNDANISGSNMIPVNQKFDPRLLQASKSILSINCFYHGCVFVKA